MYSNICLLTQYTKVQRASCSIYISIPHQLPSLTLQLKPWHPPQTSLLALRQHARFLQTLWPRSPSTYTCMLIHWSLYYTTCRRTHHLASFPRYDHTRVVNVQIQLMTSKHTSDAACADALAASRFTFSSFSTCICSFNCFCTSSNAFCTSSNLAWEKHCGYTRYIVISKQSRAIS